MTRMRPPPNDHATSLGTAKAIHDTGKALRVRLEDHEDRELWIPHSVIHEDSEVFDGDDNAEGELFVKNWFAEKEGLA